MNTSLTKINLQHNKIGDEGGKAIGEALKVNTSLTEIDFNIIILVMKGERQSERH